MVQGWVSVRGVGGIGAGLGSRAGFLSEGFGGITRIDGIMEAEKYRQVLIHHALLSGKCLIGNGFNFSALKLSLAQG